MKKRYVFARSLAKFDRDDVIYVVLVGSSQRDQIKLSLLQEYSKDAGCYLRPVSNESDKALDNLAKSLFSGCQWPRLMLRKTEVTISELYHLIIDDSFDRFERSLVYPRSFFHLLHFIDPHFSLHFNVLQSDTKLPAVRRKYLKSVKRESIQGAVINFGLILLTFIVAAYVCGHESY